MKKGAFHFCCFLSLSIMILAASLTAQERRVKTVDEDAYGSKFFEQLRTLFGMFRETELEKAFQDANPIQCSELLGRKGEWRPVAFFNEDRSLGDWFRQTLEEVRSDLVVYTFQGDCMGSRDVTVTTEFPTSAGIEDYRQQRIDLEQIDVTVNDPVKAALNTRTMAYTFELPYLFETSGGATRKIYSLSAPDRNAAYASDVTSRWECKAVASKDVTYRFLICRVSTVPRRALRRNEKWEPLFGSSAFFILSDGTEAKSSVNLTFGDESAPIPEEKTSDPKAPERPKLKR